MPNISPTSRSPIAPGAGVAPRSRMLVVRRPVKTVRVQEHRDPTPVRLAIGVITAVGVLAIVTIMGLLGDRLGYAHSVRVPGLVYGAGAPGQGLATGILILIAIPKMVFAAGLAEPLWLMLGFAAIAVPAAGLSAAKPRRPGTARPKQELEAIAYSAAGLGVVFSALLIWWTGCGFRLGLFRLLPDDPTLAAAWRRDLQLAAGLDVFALVAAALWVVLLFRLPVPTWLRALSASAAFFALVVVMVATSITGAAATQAGASRALCLREGDATPRLVLGSTPHMVATLHTRNGRAEVELLDPNATMRVVGEESIVSFLTPAD